MPPKHEPWYLRLGNWFGESFKKWFNIHPQSQYIPVSGIGNKVYVVNGQEFTMPKSATQERLAATVYILARAIERLAENEPAIAHALKPAIKARACCAKLDGDDVNLEQSVLGPFIRANFPHTEKEIEPDENEQIVSDIYLGLGGLSLPDDRLRDPDECSGSGQRES